MLEFVMGLTRRCITVAVFWIALASLSHALDNAGWAYASYLLVALLAHITIILAVLWISQPDRLQSPINAVTCLTALVLFVLWPVVKLDGGIAVTFFARQYGVLAGSGFDRLLFAVVSLTEDILPWCLLLLSFLLTIGNVINGIIYFSDHRKEHPRSMMVSFENRQRLGERDRHEQSSSVDQVDVQVDSNANPLDVFKS